jgi:hypothetical protein
MKIEAETPDDYINQLPSDRKEPVSRLRKVILENIPVGFKEVIGYGMIGYVVPHSIYPDGYHCTPKLPLPFINLASQKNHVALYHMGLYANPALLTWFTEEYSKHAKNKLDMGKGCVRFKKMDDIPYALIGQLVSKLSVIDWIAVYEKKLKN